MPRFFVPAAAVSGGRTVVLGEDAAHLARTLRVRRGERLRLVDDSGAEHEVVVDEVTPTRVSGAVAWSRPASGEPGLRLTVLQALPQGGLEGALEAMAQMGVAEVRPIITERTVVRPEAARASRRRQRWEVVAREASALAGRGRPMAVHAPAPLQDAVAALAPRTRLIALAAASAAVPVTALDVDPGRPLAVVVGPEGGLGGAELERLAGDGAEAVHLGPRILRARLAGAVAAALLLARAKELDRPPPD